MSVEAINVAERLCLMSSGRVWPISNLLDHNGDETYDESLAAFAVVGPCSDVSRKEFWVTLDLSDFDRTESN